MKSHAPGVFKVVGYALNAPGGKTYSGLFWCTKSIQRVRGPTSAGVWHKDFDEVRAVVACVRVHALRQQSSRIC